MPEKCVATLCNNVYLMIQKTTSVFIVGYNNTIVRGRFLNLRHRHQSHGHFEDVIRVISGWGLPQENFGLCKYL